MPNSDVRKQTDKEFYQYCKDVFSALIRDTFNVKDELVFITYQPAKQQLDHKQVTEHTYQLFGQIKYVEVIEQTFKVSRRYNSAAYTDNYHSHLIAKASDYNTIKDTLEGLGIVVKRVYDIEGLKEYLTKQAGNNYNRVLPTQNIPAPMPLNEMVTAKVIEFVKPILKRVIRVFQIVLINVILVKRFININKVNRMLMFVDDT